MDLEAGELLAQTRNTMVIPLGVLDSVLLTQRSVGLPAEQQLWRTLSLGGRSAAEGVVRMTMILKFQTLNCMHVVMKRIQKKAPYVTPEEGLFSTTPRLALDPEETSKGARRRITEMVSCCPILTQSP